MNDTSREIAQIQIDLVRRMPPAKRIALACEMFMSTRELILRSLAATPLTDNEKLAELYRRLYAEELPSDFFDQRRSPEQAASGGPETGRGDAGRDPV